MFEKSLGKSLPSPGHVFSPRLVPSGASFEAGLAKSDRLASLDVLGLARSDQPSHKKRHEACLSLLREAKGALESLEQAMSQMPPEMIGSLMRDPDNRRLIEDRLDEADIKLEAIRNQCSDVLPKKTMDEVADLQKRLKKVRNSIDEALSDPGGDAMKAVAGLVELAGKGLMTLLGGIGLLFNILRGPSYRGAQNDVGSRVSERS